MSIEDQIARAKETGRRLRAANKVQNEEDSEERSTPLGFFNYAESYRAAAQTLEASDFKATHPEAPIRYLYYHSLELYLKSYLRFKGVRVEELRTKYRHRFCCMANASHELGLDLPEAVIASFSHMMISDEVMRSRYLETGYFNWLALDALYNVCQMVRDEVGTELKDGGVSIRL
jgi:hypothetical protein